MWSEQGMGSIPWKHPHHHWEQQKVKNQHHHQKPHIEENTRSDHNNWPRESSSHTKKKAISITLPVVWQLFVNLVEQSTTVCCLLCIWLLDSFVKVCRKQRLLTNGLCHWCVGVSRCFPFYAIINEVKQLRSGTVSIFFVFLSPVW